MPRSGLPKLISTDLDGTIVRSDESVSAYTHEVFARARAAGIPVVGATGRGPRLLELTLRDLPSAGYLVLAGGGRVLDVSHGSPVTLADRRLDGPSVAALLDELEAAAGPLRVMAEVLDHPYAPLWGDLDPEWPWPQRVVAMPRSESLAGPVIKAFAQLDGLPGGDPDRLLALARQVVPPSKATLTQAGLGFVEICAPGVDKGSGLAVVAAALGVDPADVLVFGDMPNDVPMFRWAGWGRVAVGNAHPRVRELADEVTGTNDQDGVAVWLDRLLSG